MFFLCVVYSVQSISFLYVCSSHSPCKCHAYTGRFTTFWFMIWEAAFSYFKHFHEHSHVRVTNTVPRLISKLKAVVINSPKETTQEFWINLRSLSDDPRGQMCMLMLRCLHHFCCWRITSGHVINIVLIKEVQYFTFSSHRYWSGWSIPPDPQTEIHTHTHTQIGMCSHAPPPPSQFISFFFHIQSNRLVDGTDDCEMVRQRVQQPRITTCSLNEDKCHWLICVRPRCTWLLKGMGDDARIGLIYVLSKTHMTNSQSRYHLFVPHFYTSLDIVSMMNIIMTMK